MMQQSVCFGDTTEECVSVFGDTTECVCFW